MIPRVQSDMAARPVEDTKNAGYGTRQIKNCIINLTVFLHP